MALIASISIITLTFAALMVVGSGESSPRDDLASLFTRMEEAIRGSNEAQFRETWHPPGYEANLVGGSGLSGSRVFAQGSRKKWYLKPDLSKARTVEGVTVVPCDVWSWEQNRSVDHVDVAVVRVGSSFLALGSREDPQQVDALARRFANGEPLEPKK